MVCTIIGNLASLDATVKGEVNKRNRHDSDNVSNSYNTIYQTLAPRVAEINKREDALRVLNEQGPRWTVNKHYSPGDIVTWKNRLYECTRDHRADAPNWDPVSLINNFWISFE